MMMEENKNMLATTQQCLRRRPWWQKVFYPIIGAILIAAGIIGWILPIVPGVPLIVIGIPLLVCFNARTELRVRRQTHRLWNVVVKFWHDGKCKLGKAVKK
jgi:uncharacterized membrane protein YbaN (DUF454 family)